MSDNGYYQTVTDKKLEWKRIIIFCLFAYGIAWVFWIGLFSKYGEFVEWASNPRLSFLALMLMFPPAIANVLTRLITKEGWGKSYLHLHIKGNIKYYLAGAFVPLLYGLISGFVASFVFGSMLPQLARSGYWRLHTPWPGRAILVPAHRQHIHSRHRPFRRGR